jgi:hypothetical protein
MKPEPKDGHERGHVDRFLWPSDNHTSPVIFFKKSHRTLLKSTRSYFFFQKSPRTLAKSTRTPVFLMGRPASMGQKQPVTLFSFSTILTFLLKNRELSKFIKNHRKNIKMPKQFC